MRDVFAGLIEHMTGTLRNVTIEGEMGIANTRQRNSRQNENQLIVPGEKDLLTTIASNIPGIVYQFHARDDGSYGFNFFSKHTDETLGMNWAEPGFFEHCLTYVPQDEQNKLVGAIRDSMENDRPFHYEFPFLHPDGQKYIFRALANPERYDGKVVFNGFISDVTEQKSIIEKLESSENRLKIIIDNIEEIIHILDWQGTVLYLSPSCERVTGFPIAETVGKKFTSYVHPEDVSACLAFLNDVYKTGQPQKLMQFRVKHVSGDWVWFANSGVAVKDEQDKPLYFLGVGAEITERKQVEEYLEASEQRIRAILDNAEEVIYTLDWEGNFLFVSPAWEHITGHRVDAVMGKSFSRYTHPDDSVKCFEFLQKVRETGEPQKGIEYRVKGASGEWIWFRSTGAAIKDSQDCPCYYVGVAMDITSKKREEYERQEHERNMQHVQKLESLGVLAGGIAHDFNNILMAILGYADLALLNIDPSTGLHTNITRIKKAGERAAELCQQMLAYAGKGISLTEEIHLGELIHDMLYLLKTSISKKIEFQLDLAGELPRVKGDGSQMRQIVLNLVTNASEAIEPCEGVISIKVGTTDYCPLSASMPISPGRNPEAPWVFLEVTDTGCGMDEQTAERMFEPFFTTKFTGRGLGMAAVQGIMRSHNGHITVQTDPEKGSTFRLFFPACSTSVRHGIEPDKCLIKICKNSYCVLLVEDEDGIRELCTSMLKQLGYAVISAADGREALEIFYEKHHLIDIILLDMTMPRLDGRETLKAIRQFDSDVYVILSSGFTEVDIAGRFSGLKMSGFIQKPYTLEKLYASIQNVLEKNSVN